MRPQQKGVALITAVLVVALAAVIIAVMLDRAEVTLARTRNVVRESQAHALANGMNAWAFEVLLRDLNDNPNLDTRSDRWAKVLPPSPVPGGFIAGSMQDLDGCFNVNGLIKAGQVDNLAMQRLQRLLRGLKLDPLLADAVADWVDADSEARSRGAEDLFYLAQNTPYRAANQAMADASELRLVRGVDDDVYAKLKNVLCAYPGDSDININTASASVLMSLDDAITAPIASQLFEQAATGFSDIDAFAQALTRHNILLTERAGLTVSSRYFLLRTELVLNEVPMSFYAIIERKPGSLRVILRRREE